MLKILPDGPPAQSLVAASPAVPAAVGPHERSQPGGGAGMGLAGVAAMILPHLLQAFAAQAEAAPI